MSQNKVTRRQLAALVTAVPALSQTQAPPAPADELTAAREQLKRSGEAIAKVQVPQSLEPAFAFKA